MASPPIGPRAHGAIDYGFVALQALAPSLFNLHGPARTLCYAFAGTQGLLNTLTDQPLALRRVVPFRVHGQVETPFLPALLVLPWLTGALKQPNARRYFVSFFAVALTNYLLTDYRAMEKPAQRAGKRIC
ncbi:hypothetical protein LRS06_20490 [Hymenobacter sp. J193]|uniref:hypothetical protein n=1 Tax=Hymenobacter sp. J193 TaxID=2898429 RepID=UPI002150C966|nr:hypothetical protein [Hymenobacter sp. J193]MCR5890108.1 hypothetical protein [Hymenobacter sp. J193]